MDEKTHTAPGSRPLKYQIVRSCSGITAAVCILYGAYSIPHAQADTYTAAAESPRLVILGREEEETVALIAESILQEDGSLLSLEDFLDTLICGACSRKCPLLAPRCRRGMSKADAQSAYYAEAVDLIQQDGKALRYKDIILDSMLPW